MKLEIMCAPKSAELNAYAMQCNEKENAFHDKLWKFLWHHLQRLSIPTTCLASSKYVLPQSIDAFVCFNIRHEVNLWYRDGENEKETKMACIPKEIQTMKSM